MYIQNWITQNFKSTQCNIKEVFSQVFIDICVYGALLLYHSDNLSSSEKMLRLIIRSSLSCGPNPVSISDLRGDLGDETALPGPRLVHLQLVSQIPHLAHGLGTQHPGGPFPEHSREDVSTGRRQNAVELVRTVSRVLCLVRQPLLLLS